jgi:predicted oxidoreductase
LGKCFFTVDEQRIEIELARQAGQYNCSPFQLILAWLLKHPANISPIIGSTMPIRIVAAKQALAIDYDHADWYRLLEARNYFPQL